MGLPSGRWVTKQPSCVLIDWAQEGHSRPRSPRWGRQWQGKHTSFILWRWSSADGEQSAGLTLINSCEERGYRKHSGCIWRVVGFLFTFYMFVWAVFLIGLMRWCTCQVRSLFGPDKQKQNNFFFLFSHSLHFASRPLLRTLWSRGYAHLTGCKCKSPMRLNMCLHFSLIIIPPVCGLVSRWLCWWLHGILISINSIHSNVLLCFIWQTDMTLLMWEKAVRVGASLIHIQGWISQSPLTRPMPRNVRINRQDFQFLPVLHGDAGPLYLEIGGHYGSNHFWECLQMRLCGYLPN